MKKDFSGKNLRYLLCLVIPFLFLLNACKETSNKTKSTTHEDLLKKQKLISILNKDKETSVFKLRELANELLKINDPEAQLIGNYNLLKADYFVHGDIESLNKLLEYYPKFSEKKYEEYRLEIDFYAISMFIYKDDFKNASKTLERILKYLFQPKFEKEAISIIYTTNSFYSNSQSTAKNITEIEYLIKKYKDLPWSKTHDILYAQLAGYYNIIGNKKKTIELLELVKNNSKKANLNLTLLNTYNQLNYFKNNKDGLKDAEEGIALAHKTGIKWFMQQNYEIQGLVYVNLKEHKKAYEAFKLANSNLTNRSNFKKDPLIEIYEIWTHFVLNNKKNGDKELKDLDRILETCKKENLYNIIPIAIKRKQWIYESLGNTKMAQETKLEHDKSQELVFFNFKNKESYLNNLLLLKAKEKEFDKLNYDKKLVSEKLYRQNIIILFSLVLVGLTFFLLKQYKLKSNIVGEIKNVNEEIIDQNLKLKNVINTYNESNKYLENFGKIVAHDIKNPLFTITGYASYLNKKIRNFAKQEHIHQLDTIIEDCTRLSNYITDVQTLSRLTTNLNKKQKINIFNQISDTYNYLNYNHIGLKYELISTKNPITIETYENLIEELLQNLLLIIDQAKIEKNKVYVNYEEENDFLNFDGFEFTDEQIKEIKNTIEYKICISIINFYGKSEFKMSKNRIVIVNLLNQLKT